MLDPALQLRFLDSCTQAALGYATASTAAYARLADQAVANWRMAIEAALPEPAKPEPRSWYRHPDSAERAVPPWRRAPSNGVGAFWPMPFWPQLASQTGPSDALAMMWSAPWRVDMPLAAMPMALWMVALGVPRSVAEPTAKANLAALDAAQTAVATVEQAFANYRSESGHAVAQVIAPASLTKSVMSAAPMLVAAMGPWLALAQG